ncbi:hypothetical protein CRG98_007854 [Punica granatum]|uniref:Purple acid phosphatase n=1 Tax=Punica granatum TaxID=22663 RepID=A0A2I0KTC9_PUNGR|nr:hypothetical protein CRG98_007854 [Punica granatum]
MLYSSSPRFELQRFNHPTKPDGSLSFLVVGDWGRRGLFNQSQVASQMGRIGEQLDIDFVISTGDNFYDNGLTGEDDPEFEESFTKVYTAQSLQKQWYSGKGDAEAQLSPVLRQTDWRWLCLRSFIVNAELAEIFFVDTTPFVRSYFTDSKGHTYDWRAIKSRKAYIREAIELRTESQDSTDLESALTESIASWKIVVGHHSIRSIGHHGDTEELVKLLLPVLQANSVDFYMNGHDHCLEHISDKDSSIQFLTSGAGSKAWRGDIKDVNRKDLRFFYDGQGFMSVQLSQADAEIVFYNVFGEALRTLNASKGLHQSI